MPNLELVILFKFKFKKLQKLPKKSLKFFKSFFFFVEENKKLKWPFTSSSDTGMIVLIVSKLYLLFTFLNKTFLFNIDGLKACQNEPLRLIPTHF